MTSHKVVVAENVTVLQQDVNALLADGYAFGGDLIVTTDRDGQPKKWIREMVRNELTPAMSLGGSFTDSAHSTENADA